MNHGSRDKSFISHLIAAIVRKQGRKEEGLGLGEGGGEAAGRPVVHAVRHLSLRHDIRSGHGHR